jgi:hypothetical protein
MAIYDFFLSRNNGPTINNYVGHKGRLFYDSDNGVIKLSDGETVGGLSIPYTIATDTVAGGVKLGPGVTTNGNGQIIIDSSGLDFSFGDLASTTGTHNDSTAYAILSTINTNEDLVLASNGTGAIKIVGQFDVYKTNGVLSTILENEEPVFQVRADGQMRMLVPGADSNEGALNIIGGLNGVFQNPVNAGVMLHITGIAGTPGVPSRVYNDAQNAFAAFVSRRYNNTAASPGAVLADEEIMRLSGTAHNGTIIPGTANQRIVYVARGNQTTSNQGGAIELWATPINTITLAKIATVDSTGITLESGKVLTGNVTGDVTGNVSGSAGSVAAANITGTTLASNVVTSSLTSVGTLGSLTVTNLVSAKNYNGQARNAGTLGAAGTLTIDFATDHNVLVNLTTTATIAFSNITAGKTVTVLLKNDTGANRTITTGVLDLNTSGGDATPNVNDGRTGVFVYRTFGTASTDVYCEVNP